MRQVVLNTDVPSQLINQGLPAELLRQIVGAQAGITLIALGELTGWATLRQWGSPRRAELTTWLVARPNAPLHRRHRCVLGRDLRTRNRPRPSAAPERHLDRGLLPGLRPAPRHLAHQRLPRLRRARRPRCLRLL